jgi:hypothetical protein
MAIVYMTGEVEFFQEVDVFEKYVLADMTFIPIKEIYDIMELEESP